MIEVLVNGVRPLDLDRALGVADRGLHYGDGLFETMLLRRGRVSLLEEHLQRLMLGCARLSLPCPDLDLLQQEIQRVCSVAHEGVVKLVLTRGTGGRGYAPPPAPSVTRIVALHRPPAPEPLELRLRWCNTRLGRNVQLAGIKHLNRLEQVLAQMELAAVGAAEGLMLDSADELVSAISSNVFLVRGGVLCTPDLRHCGVKGVMRARVLRAASEVGITVQEGALHPADVQSAEEVFLTNAVRGVRAVVALDDQRWRVGPVALRLRAELQRQLDAGT